jgi:hypothetical protein
MLDFTNSSDHGALKKTTNLKVLLDVLWPLFSITSAPHGTLCAGDSEFCILVSLCKHFCAQIALGFACAQIATI